MQRWRDPAFVDEMRAWIGANAVVEGEVEQTHVQPWSTVFRVPTADGVLWAKACETPTEVLLTELLAAERADLVPVIAASDPERGWMLLRDAGRRLREVLDEDPDLGRWERVLADCGDLQLAMARHEPRLLAIRVPDRRLPGLVDAVADLLDQEELLLLDLTDGLTTADRDAMRDRLPRLAEMVAELEDVGIPASVQHDDLNDGNVYVDGATFRIVDWGDACVTHPFHALTVSLRATAYRLGLAPGGPEVLRLRDAYLEPFAAFGTRDELVRAADLAYRTGTLARSLAWKSYVEDRPPGERMPDLEAVPYGITLFVRAGPLGDWDA
jgi:hypothetical protein